MGDVALFREILAELHEQGIRVVLDGVFNHTGRSHFAFRDLEAKGPRESAYADWYHIGARTSDYDGWCAVEGDNGFSYGCWEGHAILPELNLEHPAVKEHLFDVARFWLGEVGVDGWRLDVAHEISPDFWREFRAVCKEANPDCILVGEMIHGNYNQWVGNDRLESGTNYQLSKAIWSSLNDHNFFELGHSLQREDSLYHGLNLVNFLGNHDVTRIASQLNNPAHYRLALSFLMLYKGIPCLYYGDEVAMEGTPGDGDDWDLRRPMLAPDGSDWPALGAARFAETRELIAVRHANPALHSGDFRAASLKYTNEQIAFFRNHPEQYAVVLMNCADQPAQLAYAVDQVEDGTVFVDLFDPEGPTFVARGGQILVEAPEAGAAPDQLPLAECSVRLLVAPTPAAASKLAAASRLATKAA